MQDFLKNKNTAAGLMLVGILFSLSPWASAATALLLGVAIAILSGNPFADRTRIYSQKLLSYSIIGLGAGMNLITVGMAGLSGIGITIVTISATFALGMLLGRLVKSDNETSVLISIGTAICGGSAIAAVAPVMKAKAHSITVAMGTVFLLNAVALILFPSIGHSFALSQQQFGLWCALAIHDTSSVVGAGMQYGAEALQVGTTVKLARALWIVPVTIGFGYAYRHARDEQGGGKGKKPWFIVGFLLMAALVTWVPPLQAAGHIVEALARKCLIATLFLIGANLTLATLKAVGIRPLLQGLVLWIIVATATLALVKYLPI